MELFEINPFIRFAHTRINGIHQKNFVMAYDYRLLYVHNGEMKITLSNAKYILKNDNIAIIPPATKYMLYGDADCTYTVLDFDMDFSNRMNTKSITPCTEDMFDYKKIMSVNLYNQTIIILQCQQDTKFLLKEIEFEYFKRNVYYREKISAILKTIIVNSIIYDKLDKTPESVKTIKKYIVENCSENLTNEQLGKIFTYHPNHINRLFKKYMHISLREFIIDTRLNKAVNLIKETELSIGCIGEMCGFSSEAHFIKKFKEKYGVSPLKYRYKRL